MRIAPACLALLGALSAILFTPRLAAQPRMQTQVSASQVEVGQPFEVELKALVTEGDTPRSPTLSAPAGVDLRGPSVGTRREMSFVNGTFETRKGITATWTLIAERPGNYVIGPPKVRWGGKTYDGQVVRVEVLKQGAVPRRRRPGRPGSRFDPFGFSPFDLFGPGRLPDSDIDDDLLGAPTIPEDFVVEQPADPVAFLRATVTPETAVVGEQVTYRVYAYGARGPFEEVNASEASRPKFLSHTIVENSYRQPRYSLDIDGRRYSVVKVREIALFPIEAGELTIGRMRMGFRGRGYPASARLSGLIRHSEPVVVNVERAPLGSRPPGYQPGHVGSFTLDASVQPRSISEGEAVSVTVTVDGRGYPPSEVRLPEQTGVRWLPPEVHEDIRARGSVVAGTRKLSYVVQIDEAGSIDLGEVTLPHYDAEAGRYRVVRASLGTIDVEPQTNVATPSASAPPPPQPEVNITDLATPRRETRALGPRPTPLSDTTAFWLLLALGPLGVVGLGGAGSLLKRLAARRATRGESLESRARGAARRAIEAARADDTSRTTTEVERALYTAIEARTGIKGRGVLRSELARELGKSAIEPTLANAVVDLLDSCERMRFSGAAKDGRELAEQAARAVDQVLGVKRR